jgi:hypothetical protein
MKGCTKLELEISQIKIWIKIDTSKYLQEGYLRFKVANIKKTLKSLILIKKINSLIINTKKVFIQILTEKHKTFNRI